MPYKLTFNKVELSKVEQEKSQKIFSDIQESLQKLSILDKSVPTDNIKSKFFRKLYLQTLRFEDKS